MELERERMENIVAAAHLQYPQSASPSVNTGDDEGSKVECAILDYRSESFDDID